MKKVILGLIFAISMLAGMGVQPVWAEGNICDDITDPDMAALAGCTNTDTTADKVANNVLEIVTGALGVVAIFVVIYGGFTYMTSAGDAGKVQRAKNVLIYGVVGLIVAIMAFAIVKFVGGVIGK